VPKPRFKLEPMTSLSVATANASARASVLSAKKRTPSETGTGYVIDGVAAGPPTPMTWSEKLIEFRSWRSVRGCAHKSLIG